MFEVSAANAAAYLRSLGRVPAGAGVSARELGGGVSNVVVRVDVEGGPSLVLKQSRAQLRTKAAWFSRLDRIWQEERALRRLAGILPEGTVPAILFDDRPNFLIAMTCAPDDSVVWKRRLLDGRADLDTARLAGAVLGAMHAETVGLEALENAASEFMVFDQLRIDPYYRRVAQVHTDLKPRIVDLIAGLGEPAEHTFVHADFSPKNILVHESGMTVVDFETAHAGDPAFDLGFFLAHLVLKAFRAASPPRREPGPYLALIDAFWSSYVNRAGLTADADRARRAAAHTAACVLARVDGKSPVDYLDGLNVDAVRAFARGMLADPATDWGRLREALEGEVRAIAAS